jgi:hypothetical protein
MCFYNVFLVPSLAVGPDVKMLRDGFILDVCTGGPLSPFISCKMRLWHAWQSSLPISGEFQMNMIADLLPTIDVDTAAARGEIYSIDRSARERRRPLPGDNRVQRAAPTRDSPSSIAKFRGHS